eukprot:gnl/Dysnectes_brevis/7025_a11418_258.p1 GENE.gnl/Dysnectes_brevis/7025_a11418_258~~gnl/Dysnectes_brevis/7025_a11418_258.p1  ORF type:complete len:307 (-),score=68.78 gnl/Dysnectes_brevis/7025_a11418_258:271-1191(-)
MLAKTILYFIVTSFLVYLIIKVIDVLRTSVIPKNNLAKYKIEGSWALVTGASAGIGHAVARDLAKAGYNVAILARSEDKLQSLASQIETENKVLTKVVPCDVTDSAALKVALESLNQLQIDVLINNVGWCPTIPAPLIEVEEEAIQRTIQINIIATTSITRHILPYMIKRKRGLVLFMGSSNGALPCPLLGIYSASKAYVHSLAATLAEEARAAGVDVIAAKPFWVATAMTMRSKPSKWFLSPEQFSSRILTSRWRRSAVNPYWRHALLELGLGLLPERLRMNFMHASMISTRTRIIRKLEREHRE